MMAYYQDRLAQRRCVLPHHHIYRRQVYHPYIDSNFINLERRTSDLNFINLPQTQKVRRLGIGLGGVGGSSGGVGGTSRAAAGATVG
jgi:uncharacterized membrane protein